MTDKNGTTTTMWQDNHSGLRRHKLMTKGLGDTIPAIRSTANVEDNDDVVARAKLFCPYNGWRWYVTEWDRETGLCFGLVEGFETEAGYFELTELAEARRRPPASARRSPGPSPRTRRASPRPGARGRPPPGGRA